MASRLPVPGSDSGVWGGILNDYLNQAHNSNGTLKDNSVQTTTIVDGTVTETKLSNAVQTKLNQGGNISDGSITKAKLETSVQTSLNKADSALQTAPVTTVAGRAGNVTLTESDVANLSSDLAGKEPSIASSATTNYYRGDKTWQPLNQDAVPDGTTNKAYTATEKTKLAGISGTNTGDQTSVTGNAGTATKLATARNINGVAFDGSTNITLPEAVIITANPQTTAYTLALTDAGHSVDMTSATGVAITVPPSSSVTWVVGTAIEGAQLGAGTITLTPGAGVTIRTAASLTTRAQYSAWGLRYLGSDVWLASGDLT